MLYYYPLDTKKECVRTGMSRSKEEQNGPRWTAFKWTLGATCGKSCLFWHCPNRIWPPLLSAFRHIFWHIFFRTFWAELPRHGSINNWPFLLLVNITHAWILTIIHTCCKAHCPKSDVLLTTVIVCKCRACWVNGWAGEREREGISQPGSPTHLLQPTCVSGGDPV